MRNIDDLFLSTTFIENSRDIFVVLTATCTRRVARMKNPSGDYILHWKGLYSPCRYLELREDEAPTRHHISLPSIVELVRNKLHTTQMTFQ
jgi:hypothetical protein